MLKIKQINIFVKKLNKRVNWCMDGEVNNVWEEVMEIVNIVAEEVLRIQ